MGCPTCPLALHKIQAKMKTKAILLIIVASLLGSVSEAQTQISMTAKQITINKTRARISFLLIKISTSRKTLY